MRKSWLSAALAATFLCGGSAWAADHRDGPAVEADGTTDIADMFAWMASDGTHANLVMTLAGGPAGATAATQFSNTALYVFHISSYASFGAAAPNPQTIICKFSTDTPQKISCWGPGGEYLNGAVGNTSGVASASGKMTVYAGLRNDPFFFNVRGFRALAGAVKGAAGGLTFDGAGCPAINAATSTALVQTLASNGGGGAATDDFAKGGLSPIQPAGGAAVPTSGNVLAIVLSVDKSLITQGGPIAAIWASTNMAQ